MTTLLNPIFVSDSQLFKVNVYDVDGVTALSPVSCLCSVWNADTDVFIVTNEAGTVGAGFAQYNWAGTATAGNYESTLTVTIGTGVVKSESFRVQVKAKPPTFTNDIATNIGQVRMHLGDDVEGIGVRPDGSNLSDGIISQLLTLESNSVMRAVAAACELLARQWSVVVTISAASQREELSKIHDNWLAMAVQLRMQYGGAGGTLETGVIRLGFTDADEELG